MSGGVLLTRRYVAESIRKGFASKLKPTMNKHGRGEEWDCPPGRQPLRESTGRFTSHIICLRSKIRSGSW